MVHIYICGPTKCFRIWVSGQMRLLYTYELGSRLGQRVSINPQCWCADIQRIHPIYSSWFVFNTILEGGGVHQRIVSIGGCIFTKHQFSRFWYIWGSIVQHKAFFATHRIYTFSCIFISAFSLCCRLQGETATHIPVSHNTFGVVLCDYEMGIQFTKASAIEFVRGCIFSAPIGSHEENLRVALRGALYIYIGQKQREKQRRNHTKDVVERDIAFAWHILWQRKVWVSRGGKEYRVDLVKLACVIRIRVCIIACCSETIYTYIYLTAFNLKHARNLACGHNWASTTYTFGQQVNLHNYVNHNYDWTPRAVLSGVADWA